MAQYQHLQASIAAKNSDGTSKDSVKDVLRAVQELPEYKLAIRKFTKHVNLAQECLAKFKAKNLQAVGELEQCLATNTDIEGHVYLDNKQVKERLKKIVSDRLTEQPISVLDKLRLITIYAIVQGGIPDPLLKILSNSIHPSLLRAVVRESLSDFGVDIESFDLQLSRARVQELQERNADQKLALMRYVPSLQSILEGLVENTLPISQFPYTRSGARKTKEEEEEEKQLETKRGGKGKGGPSSKDLDPEERARLKLLADAEKDVSHRATGKSARRKIGEKRDSLEAAKKELGGEDHLDAAEKQHKLASTSSSFTPAPPPQQHRYIVFMLGGLCFSEMRSCYDVCQQTGAEMIIGSTAPITPMEFLLDLSGLTRKQFQEKLLASSTLMAGNTGPMTPAAGSNAADSEKPSKSAAASSTADTKKSDAKKPTVDPSATSTKEAKESAKSKATTPAAAGTSTSTGGKKPAAPQRDAMSSSSDDSYTDTDSSDSEDDRKPASTKSGNARSAPSSTKAANGSSSSSASATPKPVKKPLIKATELVFESEEDEEEESPPPPPKKPTSTKAAATPSKAKK